MKGYPGMKPIKRTKDSNLRADAAETEIRQIISALKSHCNDDFVVIVDGAIDWRQTINEFVSFIRTSS